MEDYHVDYIAHNLPLLALSGLEQDAHFPTGVSPGQGNGVKITSELPCLTGVKAVQLLEEFKEADGSSSAWNEAGNTSRPNVIGFKMLSTGRDYAFPPRKAVPPPMAPSMSPPQNPTTSTPLSGDLHSPLSPLSPSSTLFPDGLLTSQWLTKHQWHVPSVFVAFYEIHSNQSTSTLEDNQLKTEINAIKTALIRSGFKTRFAVVLVSDKSVAATPELEDRIAGIRRATGLDPRTSLFFLPPPASRVELAAFVTSVLTALQPICVEYYRDLTKQSRRKKNRSFIPPPTAAPTRGTSQTLTTQGWNVRYEFKQGVFAEFRQEMDVAERHYSFAIEELFHSEGPLESTPSWSPRWEEARLLCDITAFRVLRCQLWRGLTTGAAESWVNYKYRMEDLIDRRGKGTATYGWSAWEGRWAEIMGQLIVKAGLPVFQIADIALEDDASPKAVNSVYAPAEKAFSAMDRLPPFHFLHHPGYWYRLSGKQAKARKMRANLIAEEDRTPPDQVPAAQVAQRVRTYESYMVPPPHEERPLGDRHGFDHAEQIDRLDRRAEMEFAQRGQKRAAQQIKLLHAQTLVEDGRFAEALDVIRPTWDSMHWRKEGWWDLAAEVLRLVHICASKTNDVALSIEAEWEMTCNVFESKWTVTPNMMQQFKVNNDAVEHEIVLESQKRLSPLSLSFAFAMGEGHVGESMYCQLTVSSQAALNTEPIVLSRMELNFSGAPRRLQVDHNGPQDENKKIQPIDVQETLETNNAAAKMLAGTASLVFRPQTIQVFEFALPLRESDLFGATGARLELHGQKCKLGYVFNQPDDLLTNTWWLESGSGFIAKGVGRDRPHMINVLAKPPKVQIRLEDLKEGYFTGEKIVLNVQIANEEAQAVHGTVKISRQENDSSELRLAWENAEGAAIEDTSLPAVSAACSVEKLAPSTSQTLRLSLIAPPHPSESTLSIQITYYLEDDPSTPLSKTLTLLLPFVNPFEAKYDLKPRVDHVAWPSFFTLPETISMSDSQPNHHANGILQRWSLATRIVSCATNETLIAEEACLAVKKMTGNAICNTTNAISTNALPLTIEPNITRSIPFVFTTQKLSLEDRRPSALDLSLTVKWRRSSSSSSNKSTAEFASTTLAIPQFTLPAAEPRVLCSSRAAIDDDVGISQLRLSYMLENPTMHFLTFTLTMSASDSFAFSGPKFKTVSLTPMSRVTVEYNLYVYAATDKEREDEKHKARADDKKGAELEQEKVKGRWISPTLKVVDAYFQKTLKVLDAGEGVRSDGKGGVEVWVAED